MKLYSNEIVFAGHPDKICDQISGAILKECVRQDSKSRVGVEVVGGKGKIFVTGEITTNAIYDVGKIVYSILNKYNYDLSKYEIIDNIGKQSQDISQGVDYGGAGDQGMMFGYACNDTKEMLPTSMVILQKFAKQYESTRTVTNIGLLADGKAQITGLYDNDFMLQKIKTFVISYQNTEVNREATDKLIKEIAVQICNEHNIEVEEFLINPTGKFLIGGFEGDSGLTGRKIVVDAYQSFANVGGGNCVDGKTEFLTPNGWIKINEYKEGDLVGQWDNNIVSFVKPYAYYKTKSKNMYHIKSDYFADMVLSENHDMVFYTSKKNLIKKRVKDVIQERGGKMLMLNGFGGRVPCSFTYESNDIGVHMTDDEIRLQVAFCADGCILTEPCKWTGRIRVVKKDKIDRLRELFERTKLPHNETTASDGYHIFWYVPQILEKRLSKCFNIQNSKQVEVIAKECLLWDGDGDTKFRTTIKEDADFVQFAFMKTFGLNASITCDDRVGEIQTVGNKDYIRKSICYMVTILKLDSFGLRMKKDGLEISSFIPQDDHMYCFSVPSTILLLRRNNRVFVTGNCNGKDSSKVDFSATHKARELAKRFLTKYSLRWCEVQLSYAIGLARPMAIYIDSNNGSLDIEENIYVECEPKNIVAHLKLNELDFEELARFGHFRK